MEDDKSISRRKAIKSLVGAASAAIGLGQDAVAQRLIRSEADHHIRSIDQEHRDRDGWPGPVLSETEKRHVDLWIRKSLASDATFKAEAVAVLKKTNANKWGDAELAYSKGDLLLEALSRLIPRATRVSVNIVPVDQDEIGSWKPTDRVVVRVSITLAEPTNAAHKFTPQHWATFEYRP